MAGVRKYRPLPRRVPNGRKRPVADVLPQSLVRVGEPQKAVLGPTGGTRRYCGKSRKPRTDENRAVARRGSFAPIDRLCNRLAWSHTGVERSRSTAVAQFSRSVPTAQRNVIALKESTSSTISAGSDRWWVVALDKPARRRIEHRPAARQFAATERKLRQAMGSGDYECPRMA